MTLSLGLMIGGALAAVLGVILLLTRMGTVKLLGGLVLAVVGLGAVGVGYTLDQHSMETFSVVEAIPISTRVDEDCYRVTAIIDKLHLLHLDDVLLEEPSLEEIFMHYYE